MEPAQTGAASALHGSRTELNPLFGNPTNDAFGFSPREPDCEERRASARVRTDGDVRIAIPF
jgi:hypothetical protein